jgi:putative PIG3 family NAD(P)H quinone oxidoreductase
MTSAFTINTACGEIHTVKKAPDLPQTMTAAIIRDQKLVTTEVPVPMPRAGEVLVRVRAAGVNRPDLLQRRGLYPPPEGVTDIPGLEISGDVVMTGSGVSGIKTGQKICALVAGGGYAEYCVVPAVQCLPLPKNLGWIAAAGIPETFFTVWTNLFERGGLQKGERVLVHGGASGIGTTAIQMARAFGAKVYVTAGSDDKCAACLKLGANKAINYRAAEFDTEILRETDGKGVDVILDMVGGDYIPRNLKILAPGGRHVSIAMQRGRSAEIDIFQIMSKRLVMTGSTLRPQSTAAKGKIAKALKKNVWPFIARKRITPVIDRIYALSEAQAAHDYLEAGQHFGKVILRVNTAEKP